MNQLNSQALDQHVTILGWLYILGHVVFLMIGLFGFAIFAGLGTYLGPDRNGGILALVGALLGGLLVVLALPGILAGFGLLRRKTWGRVLALVVGFLNLPNFPLGTALALYTFWVLLQGTADDYFAAPGRSRDLDVATDA